MPKLISHNIGGGDSLRWSPIAGCEHQVTALRCANALMAGGRTVRPQWERTRRRIATQSPRPAPTMLVGLQRFFASATARRRLRAELSQPPAATTGIRRFVEIRPADRS